MIGHGVTELDRRGRASRARSRRRRDELRDTSHAHPTLAEALREAALAARRRGGQHMTPDMSRALAIARWGGCRTTPRCAGRRRWSRDGSPAVPDALLLLEHPPVYTLGRGADARFLGRGRRRHGAGGARRAAAGRSPTTDPGSSSAIPIVDLRDASSRRALVRARARAGAHRRARRRRDRGRTPRRAHGRVGRARARSPRSASRSAAGSPGTASRSTSARDLAGFARHHARAGSTASR